MAKLVGIFACCCFVALCSGLDCNVVDNLTLPSRCCHKGHNLWDQDTLKECMPSVNDWYRSLKTIHCYLETKGLIVDNKVDVNRTNAHLKDDYPVKESVLGACSNTLQGRPLLDGEPMSGALIDWFMCIEKSMIGCPPEDVIESSQCSALRDFLDECSNRRERMDYVMGLVDTL